MAFDENGNEGSLTGSTPVTAVAAPSSGKRIVKYLSLHNKDTVSHVVTILANSKIIWKGTLSAGDTWEFGDVNEIIILTTSKSITMASDATATTAEPEFQAAYADHS